MYSMRKIITHDEDILLPKCMYNLKNIYSWGDTFESREKDDVDLGINKQVIQFLKNPCCKMTELELRQDQLLKKLDLLYDRIKNLSSICTATSNQESRRSSKSNLPTPEEVVLAVGPDNLPWFIKAYLKQKSLSVNINWHIHSSVPNEKIAKIQGFVKDMKSSVGTKINLRLIFKGDIQDSQLKLSSLAVPIVGNVNILRYLALAYPSVVYYNTEDYIVDSLLDICHMLERVPEKNKEALVNKLFLQSKKWIYNNEFSIVDLAAYNVIKQWRNASKFVPKEWIENCDKICF